MGPRAGVDGCGSLAPPGFDPHEVINKFTLLFDCGSYIYVHVCPPLCVTVHVRAPISDSVISTLMEFGRTIFFLLAVLIRS